MAGEPLWRVELEQAYDMKGELCTVYRLAPFTRETRGDKKGNGNQRKTFYKTTTPANK